jgi:dihydrofolate reductase
VANLIYSVIASVDGYTADANGDFDWAAPDEQVHRYINDLERPIGTYLYGRRMYETMAVWETMDHPGNSDAARDFARVWQAADKIVFSRTLDGVSTARTRLVRDLDPDAVRALKATAQRAITVGGPHLAGQALAAGLVDEVQLFAVPQVVGGGTPWLPDGVRYSLELLEERRFDNGTVFLRYRVRHGTARQLNRSAGEGVQRGETSET